MDCQSEVDGQGLVESPAIKVDKSVKSAEGNGLTASLNLVVAQRQDCLLISGRAKVQHFKGDGLSAVPEICGDRADQVNLGNAFSPTLCLIERQRRHLMGALTHSQPYVLTRLPNVAGFDNFQAFNQEFGLRIAHAKGF